MDQPLMSLMYLWAGPRIPRGYLACQGQLLPISQYDALYALIGTTYGGDGINTFALPDLRSRIPVGSGTGPGLTSKVLGQAAGTEQETLTTNSMPTHNHVAGNMKITVGTISAKVPAPLAATATMPARNTAGSSRTPGSGLSYAQTPDISGFGEEDYIYGNAGTATMPVTVNVTTGQSVTLTSNGFSVSGVSDISGGSQPHENRQPFVVMNYIIAVTGIFPSQP